MIFDGITLVEGSEIQNLVVATGPTFPAAPDTGELFFLTSGDSGLHMYDGTQWLRLISTADGISDTLPDIVAAGQYAKVTVNTKGLVTAGINPTTLAGYGITDAQPLDEDLTAIANLGGISGVLRKTGINTWTLDTGTYLTQNQAITLSGDASGTGSTSIAVTLANTGVAAGTYGTASNVAVIGVDSKGRITSAANTPIQLDASAVTSGSFANGRISQTSVTQHQAALTISESQITDGTILSRNNGNETITGSWAFTNPVTGATPTASGHLVTKSYVDSLSVGLDFKESVRATTVSEIVLSGLQTIDGVSLSEDDRVLVRNQSAAQDNGIYLAKSGAWVRSADADGSPAAEVSPGMFCFVEEGDLHADTGWVLATDGPVTLGVTPLIFTKFSGGEIGRAHV